MQKSNNNQQIPLSPFFFSMMLFFLLAVITPSIHAQTTYHVKPTGNDANDGQTWATAFQTLQTAINTASAGDAIWVAEGTYLPTEDSAGNTNPSDERNKVFHLNEDIELLGGFPSIGNPTIADRNWQMHLTVLDGELQGDANNGNNAYTILYPINRTNACTIDGFTIQNAQGVNGQSLENAQGGGIFLEGSSATVVNCRFVNIVSIIGGAIYIRSSQNARFINCAVYRNVAEVGGAVFGREHSTVFTNCTFSGNVSLFSDGIFSSFSPSPTFTNCIIWENDGTITQQNGADASVNYSIVQGGWTGAGSNNLNQDPLFIDPNSNNFRISACSPAIDAGDNTADLDAGGSETQTISDILFDLAHNDRQENGTIDIGAFEDTGSLFLQVNSPICSGEELQLGPVASDQLNFQWSGPQNFTSTEAMPTIPNVSEGASGNYNVTVSDGLGCSAIGELSVTVKSSPVPSISGKTEYYESQNSTLLNAGNWSSYKWSNGFTTQTIEAVEGTYTVTVTNTSNCTGIDQVSVIQLKDVPTLSQWGLINLALLLMICGVLVLIQEEKMNKWNLV